jgi:hypothetical protein
MLDGRPRFFSDLMVEVSEVFLKNHYNSNTILLKPQYSSTPTATCLGPRWPIMREGTVVQEQCFCAIVHAFVGSNCCKCIIMQGMENVNCVLLIIARKKKNLMSRSSSFWIMHLFFFGGGGCSCISKDCWHGVW